MPAQSYLEHLDEMIQDGLLRACLEAEAQHFNNNGAETSHHVAMYFDGSTFRSKKRLPSSPPEDFETFRMQYAFLLNVWRMLAREISTARGTRRHFKRTQKVAHGRTDVQTGC